MSPNNTWPDGRDQDGFVKHSNYYAGNINEPKTFTDVLSELEPFKHGIQRPVIVMDAGIATEDNLKMSLSKEIDYLCVSRSGHKNLLAKVDKDKLVCFVNKNGQEVRTQFFRQNNRIPNRGRKIHPSGNIDVC